MSLFGRWGVMAVFYRGSGLRTSVSVAQHNVPSEKNLIKNSSSSYTQGASTILREHLPLS